MGSLLAATVTAGVLMGLFIPPRSDLAVAATAAVAALAMVAASLVLIP
jgi:hypothetical protein